MQSDDVIWQLINQVFCSFKAKTLVTTFCRNKYNVSGFCNRFSCPLANSRYATVLEEKGICYLYMKTIERAHTPNKLWEKIPLSKNYQQALDEIDKNLEFWPRNLRHHIKVRLTKIHQYLIRMRKLRKVVKRKTVRFHKKVERREATREAKAEKAALIDQQITKELIDRLKKGVYEADIVNYPQKSFEGVLEEHSAQPQEDEYEIEYVVGDYADEEVTNLYNVEEDPNLTEEKSNKRKRSHIEIEYEQEVPTQKQKL